MSWCITPLTAQKGEVTFSPNEGQEEHLKNVEATALERFRTVLIETIAGESLRSVEKRAGLSHGILNRILSGDTAPSFSTTVRLSTILKADLFAPLELGESQPE